MRPTSRPAFLALACLLAGQALAQAHLAPPRFAPAPEHAAPLAAPPSSARPLAPSPYSSAEAERCANLRRELRAARARERDATTTVSREQALTHRREIAGAKRKAGC